MRISEVKAMTINEKELKYCIVEFDTDTQDLRDIKPQPSFENAMENDEDVFNEFIDWSNDSSYICDAITEIADNNCDIYNSDLWKNAPNVSEYIEEAISEGLVDTHNLDLMRTFQAGEYEYYTQALYSEIDELCIGWMVENVIKGTKFALIVINNEDLSKENILQEFIENLANQFDSYNGDHNNRFWDLEEHAKEMLDDIATDLCVKYEDDGLIITRLEDEEEMDDFEDQVSDWLECKEIKD